MAAAASCALQGAESEEADSAELAVADSRAAATSPLPSGSRIDRAQLVQLLGDKLPAGVGESCPILGQVCAPQRFAEEAPCGSFSDTCDMTGTHAGVLIDFICLNNNGSATCTAVAQQTTVTRSCTRETNGLSCGSASCGTPFCAAYSSTCDEGTSQVRNCKAAGTCSSGVCNQPVTQQVVGTCQRDTDGKSCPRTCADGDDVATCRNGGCACPRIVGCPDAAIAACPQQ